MAHAGRVGVADSLVTTRCGEKIEFDVTAKLVFADVVAGAEMEPGLSRVGVEYGARIATDRDRAGHEEVPTDAVPGQLAIIEGRYHEIGLDESAVEEFGFVGAVFSRAQNRFGTFGQRLNLFARERGIAGRLACGGIGSSAAARLLFE